MGVFTLLFVLELQICVRHLRLFKQYVISQSRVVLQSCPTRLPFRVFFCGFFFVLAAPAKTGPDLPFLNNFRRDLDQSEEAFHF